MTEKEVRRILEAVLLCARQPLSIQQLRKAFEPFDLSRDIIKDQLAALQQSWQDRGLELVQVASGWRFQNRADIQPYLLRLQNDKPARYSRATLETLAIIAWRQPVTRGDIEDIRGVGVSTQIIRTLEDRGWIEVLGYRDAPGKPALFGTTKQFLDDLSLRSIQDLPALDSTEIDVIQQALTEPQPDHSDYAPSVQGADSEDK